MQPSNHAELQSLWSFLYVSRLYSLGLDHIFISPGSRSTPLVQAVSCIPGLQKHVILDERSAAFTALGAAKSSGKPTALICTSGTALANYYPAIVEAKQSGTPLIIITADRPPRDRGTGSNQTINQIEIYGNYTVYFEDAGEAEFTDEAFQHISSLAETCWTKSNDSFGPVHINFPFDKPLESGRSWLDKLETIAVTRELLNDSAEEKSEHAIPDGISNLIEKSDRILAIAGPMRTSPETENLRNIISKWEIPVLAEAGSQLTSLSNAISGSDAFLRDQSIKTNLKPNLIIRLGRQPVSKGINSFLESCIDVPHIIIPHNGYSDNAHFADEISNFTGNTRLLSPLLEKPNKIWITQWKTASQKVLQLISSQKNASLTDWHAYQEIIPNIPEDWFIMASNSFPARDLDLSASHLISQRPVYLNRGASGIDGITSTAIGLTIGKNQSGVLFTGDLAFLHDTNALLQAQSVLQTLIVVINNNRGGQIFRMLPFENLDDSFTKYFETPQQVHINQLSKAYNVTYRQARKPGDLQEHFRDLAEKKGLHIIEALTDPEASMERRKSIWRADYS